MTNLAQPIEALKHQSNTAMIVAGVERHGQEEVGHLRARISNRSGNTGGMVLFPDVESRNSWGVSRKLLAMDPKTKHQRLWDHLHERQYSSCPSGGLSMPNRSTTIRPPSPPRMRKQMLRQPRPSSAIDATRALSRDAAGDGSLFQGANPLQKWARTNTGKLNSEWGQCNSQMQDLRARVGQSKERRAPSSEATQNGANSLQVRARIYRRKHKGLQREEILQGVSQYRDHNDLSQAHQGHARTGRTRRSPDVGRVRPKSEGRIALSAWASARRKDQWKLPRMSNLSRLELAARLLQEARQRCQGSRDRSLTGGQS